MPKIHGSVEFKEAQGTYHIDICPPGCTDVDNAEWQAEVKQALDKWLTRSKGTGFFILKQEKDFNEEPSDLTQVDLKTLALLQIKIDKAVESRLSQINSDYLNSKEATHISNMHREVTQGIDEILGLFSFLDKVEPGSYDGDRRSGDIAKNEGYTQLKHQFDLFGDQ